MAERDNKGRFVKGMTTWNKGITKETDDRVKQIAENQTRKNKLNKD